MLRVKRLGTAKLLQLTEALDDESRKTLLQYVGYLETSENQVFTKLEDFMRGMGQHVDFGREYKEVGELRYNAQQEVDYYDYGDGDCQ